jgi:preprotein translocase subunit SecE
VIQCGLLLRWHVRAVNSATTHPIKTSATIPTAWRRRSIASFAMNKYFTARPDSEVGGVVVAFMARMKQGFGNSFSFFTDAWSELKKVKWPSRKEMTSYTVVVICTVVFVTIYFSILDLGISELVRLVSK